MNTETKLNWPSLVGLILLSGAVLYPFISINGNASPFDHFLRAGYGYDNPNLDYGESGKPLMLKALPFEGEVNEDGMTIEDVDPIGGTTIQVSEPIESSEPVVLTTQEPPAQSLIQPPTQSVISDSFPNHLPQDYTGNGHQ